MFSQELCCFKANITVFVGRIINIESLDCKFSNWTGGADPDESFWAESGKNATFFLTTVRVFYKQGPPAYETIGILYECA